MRNRNLRFVRLVLFAMAVTTPLAAWAQSKLPSRESDEGTVMVTVTPQSLSSTANTWRFDVQFNTHTTPVTQDPVIIAVLSDGNGHDEHPSAWKGDPAGGHHRKGVLLFKPISPPPASLTLHIHDAGGVADRSFTWNLARP